MLLGDPPMRILLILFCASLLASLGCSGKPVTKENPAGDRLRRILQAFDVVVYEKRRGPKNADEIKPFLKGPTGKDNPDEVLKSPNDGELFEIAWGTNLETVADSNMIVVQEKKGSGGVRYGITAARIVKKLEAAEPKEKLNGTK